MFCKCFALWKQPTSVTARVTNVQTMCESFPNQEVDDLTRRLQDETVKDLLNIQVDLGEIGLSMPQLVPVSSNQGKGDGVQSRLLHESFREHGIVTFPKFLHCRKLCARTKESTRRDFPPTSRVVFQYPDVSIVGSQ